MDKKRRLAAIMFTDIAGYTRLMQESESRAAKIRERHRKVFEHFHGKYHGTILQYYGDGTLSIFDSSVDAVNCAIAIQQDLQTSPIVPLRIGIHLGDIVMGEKDVYGDGVNIASRIESLSMPGSVLVSEDVQKQVKNQEIESLSLGTFEMKNVANPVHVYAIKAPSLLIPQPGEMQGKAKQEKAISSTPLARQWVRFGGIGFLAMALGAVLFWALGSRNTEQSRLLAEEIREEKVAVSVFENFTGDANLDALGYLGSEWISSGLRELKIRTVSPEMVRQYADKVGILPNNPENKASFAEITGAKYVVSGSYFLQGDSIVLNTRLSSTESGDELQNFPQLKRHKDHKENLIEDAREYLLGYWVLRKDQQLSLLSPPKYEAYQLYLKAYEGGGIPAMRKAFEIDPDFLLARLWILYDAMNFDKDSIFYANKEALNQRLDLSTAYEKNFFKEICFMWEGDYEAALNAWEENYKLDPRDYFAIHESGFLAIAALNRLDIGIERYERLFEEKESYEGKIGLWPLFHYMNALIRKGEYEKVIDFYFGLPNDIKDRTGFAIYEVVIALIYQNRIEQVNELITQRGNRKDDLLRAAYSYAYIYPDSIDNPFSDGLRNHVNAFDDPTKSSDYLHIGRTYFNWNSRVMANYVLKEWEEAEKILLKLRGFDWPSYGVPTYQEHQHEFWIEAMLGCIYAQQGNRKIALTQLDKVQELGDKYHNNHHSPYSRGATEYLIARIYAILGEKEKAVESLRKSIENGRMYHFWNITFDLDFVNLKGYEPFEELIRPKE